MTRNLLREAVVMFVTENLNEIELPESDPHVMISKYFMSDFCQRHKILLDHKVDIEVEIRNGRLTMIDVLLSISDLQSIFLRGTDESRVFNLQKTHFIIDEDNGKILGFLGKISVNYNEVSNATNSFTVVLLVHGGPNACIESVLVIFKNAQSKYPIQHVTDKRDNV